MSALSINPPFPVFPDTDGQPLEDGYIWIGTAGLNPLTNPIVVYWDAALTLPAGQPVRTINGFPSRAGTPAMLYVDSDYSIQVQNKNGSVVYSSANATEILSSDLVTFIQAGFGAVQRTVQSKLRETVSVKDFGAVGDGVANDTAAINAAISYAATTINGATGNTVYFPTGTYLIDSTIQMPNRVGLQGANGRGTIIKPHSSFTDLYMFHAVNGTSSMFGSWIKDMEIDSRGKTMTAVVWSQAWQETGGMERVVILFDGATQYGFLYTDGFGGAAYLLLKDCEIFSDSSAVNSTGVFIGQVSLVGGFIFSWQGGTITGSLGNNLVSGIRLENDTLHATDYHGEFVQNMIVMQGVGGLSVDTLTGSFNNVTNIVSLASTFSGIVSLRNILPNGATGNVLDDGVTNRDIPASEGMLAEYYYQPSAFMATVGTQINNVTGNGTEYVIVFDSQVYDYLSEYNASSGFFTPIKTGKYLFSVCVGLNVPANSTTALIKLVTSSRDYEIYRGSFANQRDGSNNITINGAVVAEMNSGTSARISVTIVGIGADTVDVLTTSTFSGQWLTR